MTKLTRLQSSHKFHLFSILSTCGLLLATTAALADPAHGNKPGTDHAHRHGPPMGARLFEHWDSDHDGRITITQLPARLQDHIRTTDQNKDGILTREEFDKGMVQLKSLREKKLDRNGDGNVTEEERREAMRARVVKRFVEQDKDHDGFVVASEVPAPFWEHMKPADANSDSKLTLEELKTAFDEGKLRPPNRAPTSQADMKAHAQERFSQQDKNQDGVLTETEVTKAKWEHFKVADANNDNRVSFDELSAAFKAGKFGSRGRHGGPRHRGPGQAEQK